ncbi:MAG: LamG-like jellyroll fold domain-containing protein, partial [Kiritimatiellia bacterium]|nr:LamG-like jellyroll fold domain-containing protein [Kiritimatiellia bacterium]
GTFPDLRLSPTGAGPFTYDWTYYEIVRTATTNAFFGSGNGAVYYFKGALDDMRIYNRELASDEVELLISQGDLYPLPAIQTTDLHVWDNYKGGLPNNFVRIGTSMGSPRRELDGFLQHGRDFHTNGVSLAGYAPYPYPHPRTALVAHWTLDETTGTLSVDNSAGGHNATNFGTIGTTSGFSGNARLFSGANGNYIETQTYSADLNPASFSVSAWARVDGSAGVWRTLLSSRGDGSGYNIYAGTDNKWQFWTGRGAGQGFDTLTGPAIEAGVWTHIVVTFDGGTLKKTLYVNGVSTNKTAPSFAVNSSTKFRIGALAANSWPFNGAIDDVRVYNRVLSEQEIGEIYNLFPNPSFEEPLAAGKWKVRSGTPSTVDTESFHQAKSLYVNKPGTGWQLVELDRFIPVRGGKDYVLSAWVKATGLLQGASSFHTLYLCGRWYDQDMREIGGTFPDLRLSPTGAGPFTYDWTYYEIVRTA